MDKQRNLDNHILVLLLNELSAGSRKPELLETIYRNIAEKANFLLRVRFTKAPSIQADGSYVLPDGGDMIVPSLKHASGQEFFPIFTDYMELAKWADFNPKEDSILTMALDDCVGLIAASDQHRGFVVNPFTQSLILEKGLVFHLQKTRDGGSKSHRTIFDQLIKK